MEQQSNMCQYSANQYPATTFIPHRWHEECGVFGLWAPGEEVDNLCYLGLFALQHRGQESAGIAVTNGLHIDTVKGMGLMSDAFRNRRPTLDGHAAIGHVRYSTQGSNSYANIQPMFAFSPNGFICLAHNGNLTNTEELKTELTEEGCIFQTTTDSEVMLNLIARSKSSDLETRITESLKKVQGAFSLIIMTADKIIGIRDPHGYRPLCLGKLESGGFVLASESCALDAVKADLVRDITPGEMIIIDADGCHSSIIDTAPRQSNCVFEHIYFARPDSVLDGLSVWLARFRMGQQLAREFKAEADIVIPIPDTGITAALGFSKESGLPYTEGLIKNRYVGRSFIMPQQTSRQSTVEMKLNPVKYNLKGKRVVVIDDSIVRGTTSARIISLIRRAEPSEVHMCVSSPPITQPCYYGIDTSIRRELIAAMMSVDGIREKLAVDSLLYLSQAGLLESVFDPENKKNCMACFA